MNWSKTAFRTSFFPNPTWTVSRGSIGLNASVYLVWQTRRRRAFPSFHRRFSIRIGRLGRPLEPPGSGSPADSGRLNSADW